MVPDTEQSGGSDGVADASGMDYSTSQVPDSATYSGWHIALIVVGCTIAVPSFLMAANIGARLGLQTAAVAFGCGCLVLGILAALTGLAGQRAGLSAYMLSELAFGRWGGRVASLVVACTLIGWFGVTSTIFGRAASQLALDVFGADLPEGMFVVIGGGLIVAVAVAGISGIDKLAMALVPLMLAFLGYTAYRSLPRIEDWTNPTGGDPMTLSTAISAVIGGYIVGVTIQPDYSRFARSAKAALTSAFVALAISFPIILFGTAIPAIAFGDPDLLNVMIGLGVGVPAFALLVLAAWSSNVLSVYSGSLSLATVFRGASLRWLILAVGFFGTLLGLLQVGDYLIEYLVLLGITIPPISSVYVLNALLLRTRLGKRTLESRRGFNSRALVSWAAGVGVGYLAHTGTASVTTVAAIDSVLVSAVMYLGCATLAGPRGRGVVAAAGEGQGRSD